MKGLETFSDSFRRVEFYEYRYEYKYQALVKLKSVKKSVNEIRLCIVAKRGRIKESCWCSEVDFYLILSDLYQSYYRSYYH